MKPTNVDIFYTYQRWWIYKPILIPIIIPLCRPNTPQIPDIFRRYPKTARPDLKGTSFFKKYVPYLSMSWYIYRSSFTKRIVDLIYDKNICLFCNLNKFLQKMDNQWVLLYDKLKISLNQTHKITQTCWLYLIYFPPLDL